MSIESQESTFTKVNPDKYLKIKCGLLDYKTNINFVKKNSDINITDLITIFISKGENITYSEILKKIQYEIKNKYWFCNDLFSEKVNQANQIPLRNGEMIYDFSNLIDFDKFQTISAINFLFSDLANKYSLKLPKNLIFDNIQEENFNSGSPMNGELRRNLDTIRFFPAIFEEGRYRKFEQNKFPISVDHFIAVLIHEYSHFFEPLFIKEWKEKFGWIQLERAIELSEGVFKLEECISPENCISDYALYHAREDFCESMVGFLLCPDVLKEISIEKYKFLENVVGSLRIDFSKIFPFEPKNTPLELPEDIYVKIQESEIVWT